LERASTPKGRGREDGKWQGATPRSKRGTSFPEFVSDLRKAIREAEKNWTDVLQSPAASIEPPLKQIKRIYR